MRPHRFTNAAANSSVQQKNTRCYPFYVFCQHILNHPSKTTLPCCILCAGELSITKWYYAAEMEARQHLLAQVVVVTQRTPAPAYNVVAVSRGRIGLQRRGRLSCPHRFKTPRPTDLSTPAANSDVIDFSFTMVIINSTVDNFWPDISGEVHPVYFYITYCFL